MKSKKWGFEGPLTIKPAEDLMIISFSGPSGIGKGFVKERLLQVYSSIEELTWLTTRPLRPNEIHGNRIYVSSVEFDRLVESGKINLVQNLYGNRYGLRREDLLPSTLVRLTELHPDNVEEALNINPDIVLIGFVTPDLSLLYERLSILRRTESPEEIRRRIALAKTEIKTILRLRSLFTSVIEVTRASEAFVFDQVRDVLTPHLTKKGG